MVTFFNRDFWVICREKKSFSVKITFCYSKIGIFTIKKPNCQSQLKVKKTSFRFTGNMTYGKIQPIKTVAFPWSLSIWDFCLPLQVKDRKTYA